MKGIMLAALFTDGYKTFHESATHEDIVEMYGNFTNRSGRLSNLPDNRLNGVASVGLQYLCIDFLIKEWNETFFNVTKKVVIKAIKRYLDAYLNCDYDMSHYEALHDLGFLPLEIKAVPEGTIVPYGVAPFTVRSTVDGFDWTALYLETVISTETWPMNTSATTAAFYMAQTIEIFREAGLSEDLIPFMAHDFSMRGCFGRHAGAMSGFSHLSAGNCGTDTLPAIMFAEKYYGADVDKELVGCSVKATEHSITTSFIMAYSQEHNVSLFEAEVVYARMLLKKNPTGILSYVADSFDFWRFVTEGLDLLKEDIMARDGVFVTRPDTGIPEDILCGTLLGLREFTLFSEAEDWAYDQVNDEAQECCGQGETGDDVFFKQCIVNGEYQELKVDVDYIGQWCDRGDRLYSVDTVKVSKIKSFILTPEQKGLIEILYEKFPGETNEKGIRTLDSHIGAIYGDSITPQRQALIAERLIAKKLTPSVVMGVGSYSYQMVTRDTHGSAMKCTAARLKDKTIIEVCKDPKTDPSKKSAKGLLRLEREDGEIVQYDQQTSEQEQQGLLEVVFRNSILMRFTTLEEIRDLMSEQISAVVEKRLSEKL